MFDCLTHIATFVAFEFLGQVLHVKGHGALVGEPIFQKVTRKKSGGEFPPCMVLLCLFPFSHSGAPSSGMRQALRYVLGRLFACLFLF